VDLELSKKRSWMTSWSGSGAERELELELELQR
jgi:hypothetical protein